MPDTKMNEFNTQKIMTIFGSLLRIIILSLIILIISCSKDNRTSQRSEKDGICLTYWCSTNPNEIRLAKERVAYWNETHPDIRIKLQPIPASQSSEEVLLAAIAGKTTPDICSNMWPGAMDDFTSSGGLVELDKFPDFADYMLERIPQDLLETFQAPDGHYYQLPWKTNPAMIVYNVRIFREAGVTKEPRTYSEYFEVAKKVTKDRDGDGNIDQWMAYRDIKPIWWQRLFDFYPIYIAASGGKTLFDCANIAFNNEAAVGTFRFFQELYAKGYYPVATMQGDNFIMERLASQLTGPFFISYIEKFIPDDFEYDVMPVPVPDDYKGPVYTYGDFKNISIFSTTKYPQEAWEFSKYLISKESDLKMLKICSQIPLRKNLITDPMYQDYFKQNPKIAKFAKQVTYTRGVDGVSDLKEIFDSISQEYEACAIYGARDPQEAVASAAKRSKVIMDWNRSR